jgi:choline dehydrogenase-like flavoprotein
MRGATRATVAIVGAGASGSAVAWRLARAGIDVLCIEQGDWLDQAKSPSLGHDWERALQTRFHPNPNIRRGAADYPVDRRGHADPASAVQRRWWRAAALGRAFPASEALRFPRAQPRWRR